MKKNYTRRQIVEAMEKWQKVLESLDQRFETIEDFCRANNYSEDIYNSILEKIALKLDEDVFVDVNGREDGQDFEYNGLHFISNVEGECIKTHGSYSSSSPDPSDYYGEILGTDVQTSIDQKKLDEIGLSVEDLTDYDDVEIGKFNYSLRGPSKGTFSLLLKLDVKVQDQQKLKAFLGNSIPLIDEEEAFLPKASKQSISESEDGFDNVQGITSYFARDLIFEDAPDGVKVCQIPDSRYFALRNLPFDMPKEDIERTKKTYQENPQYRIMAYYAYGYSDPKWNDASESVEDENDFNDYIDRDSSIWKYDQEAYEDVAVPFMKQFPTYQDWVNHKASNAKRDLLEAFSYSNKLPYESIREEEVKTTHSGTAYALIVWRA